MSRTAELISFPVFVARADKWRNVVVRKVDHILMENKKTDKLSKTVIENKKDVTE